MYYGIVSSGLVSSCICTVRQCNKCKVVLRIPNGDPVGMPNKCSYCRVGDWSKWYRGTIDEVEEATGVVSSQWEDLIGVGCAPPRKEGEWAVHR